MIPENTDTPLPADCHPQLVLPSSDTPETDSIDTSQKARSWEVAYWNMRELARKLERERNYAQITIGVLQLVSDWKSPQNTLAGRRNSMICGTCNVIATGAASMICERKECPGKSLENV